MVYLLFCVGYLLVQGCIHDFLDHQFVAGAQVYDDSHPFITSERRLRDEEGTGRKLATSTFQPIRMTPYYDNTSLSKLPDNIRTQVSLIVTEAIQRITRALQVVPVSGNLFAHRFCTSYFSYSPQVCHSIASNEMCLEMPIPDDHFASLQYCGSCSSTGCSSCVQSPQGNGVANTDFLIYVRAESTVSCADGKTLAYASTCQQDQYDRPTFGMVNFCPAKLSTAAADFERQVSTALHEFTHALGFSSRFFPLMRNEDGTPRTPRDQTGRPPTFTSGTCPNGKAIDYYVQPANTTVQYTTERDHVVAKMVTPRVQAFVQQHFNCSTLQGAEIESQDGGCLGSHWEERIFEPEYMSPVDSYRNIFSALTLAFFEDSGWYRVNASTAQRLHFGRLKGCSFATQKCIDPPTQVPVSADTYCTTNAESCSVDAISRSVCSLSSAAQTIPTEYQYFPGYPNKGGVNTFADFCPMNVGYTDGDCSITGNLAKLGTTSINMLGETYCPSCKCTPTSLRSADSKGWTITNRLTGCYAMRCIISADAAANASSIVVEITIPRSKTLDTVSVNCTKKGEVRTVSGFTGDITCPDPFVVCDVDDPSKFLVADSTYDSGDTSKSSSGNTTGSGTANTRTTASGVSKHHQAALALLGVAWLIVAITF